MLDSLQREQIEDVAFFCYDNIKNNNDFASHLNAPELVKAQQLYASMTDTEAGTVSDIDVVYYLFSELLSSSSHVPVDLDFLNISKETDLAIIKQKAIDLEIELQRIRTAQVTIDEYINVIVKLNALNILIYEKEVERFENNIGDFFNDIECLRSEVVELVRLGLDSECQTVATIKDSYFFVLLNFFKFNVRVILHSAFTHRNTELVANLKQGYGQRLAVLQNDSNPSPTLIQYLTVLSEYSELVIRWTNVKATTAEELARMYVLVNKLITKTTDTDLYSILKIDLFFNKLENIALNWILNAQDETLTAADVKERIKFISFWQQYLDQQGLNNLLKQLTMWQYQFNGKALKDVLACKLKLERAYADCLNFQELKDYYDFIASQTIEQQLLLIGVWQDQELVTVRIHEQKLLGYVASKIDEFSSTWYHKKYNPSYPLDLYPNPRATTVIITAEPKIDEPLATNNTVTNDFIEEELITAIDMSQEEYLDSATHERGCRPSTPFPFMDNEGDGDEESSTSISPDTISNDSTDVSSPEPEEEKNGSPPSEKSQTTEDISVTPPPRPNFV